MQTLLCRKVPAEHSANLATDVYLPDGPGPFPTVLVRTPYHRVGLQSTAHQFTQRGYSFVAQDCRGKYDSDGAFVPLVDEAHDGQTTLDWTANQRWCNGRIGLWGRSYLGIVQVPAACGGHEALRCIAPSVAPGSFFRDWIRYDGCFALGNAIRWSLTHASCRNQPPMAHFLWNELNHLTNPEAIAGQVGFETPVLSDWAAHDHYDDYWKSIDQCLMHQAHQGAGISRRRVGSTTLREGSLRLTKTSGIMVRQNWQKAGNVFSSDRGGIEISETRVRIIVAMVTGILERKQICRSLHMSFSFLIFI